MIKKLKILWFTLTPCGASEHLCLDSQGGGWLSSLEKHINDSMQIELHICFKWDTETPSFSLGGTIYHPVRRDRMKNKLIRQFSIRREHHDSTQLYAKVITDVKPDLIHVHGTEEDFGLIQAITHIPVIISMQGILTNYVSRYFSGLSFSRLLLNENISDHLKLKSILTNYAIFKNNAKRERHILSMAKHVIGRTVWDRRTTTVLAPKAQYYNGDEILREQFYDCYWSCKSFASPLRIITVTSTAPYKGYEAILNVARILQELDGLDFIWTVIGLSMDDINVKITHKWLGNNQKVQLIGRQTGNEIRNILLGADIYCQVSHIENSPNSLCEAMLVGMPIVASFAGGTDSMLTDGVEGLLVQDGDPWSMAGAIVEMSRDEERAKKMGHAARIRAQERHNPKRIVDRLLSVYSYIYSQNQIPNQIYVEEQ